jgi:hypothetical protein
MELVTIITTTATTDVISHMLFLCFAYDLVVQLWSLKLRRVIYFYVSFFPYVAYSYVHTKCVTNHGRPCSKVWSVLTISETVGNRIMWADPRHERRSQTTQNSGISVLIYLVLYSSPETQILRSRREKSDLVQHVTSYNQRVHLPFKV